MKIPVAMAFAGLGLIFATVALSAPPALGLPAPAGTATAAAEAGRKVYMEACAACHGADGKGVSQSLVGFTQPIRDFTDCRSMVREPQSDWTAVVRFGGEARGFSELMPAFGDALKPEEVAAVVAYLRTFCPDRAWPRGELNLPRAQFTEKAFPEDEAVLTTAVDTTGHGLVSNAIIYEQRFGARMQVELAVPFGWQRAPDTTGGLAWSANLGDASAGLKRLLYHDYESGSILSATAEIIAPTGDRAHGFGRGTFIFEPFVSFGRLFAADVFLQAQAGLEIPFRTSKAENEAYFNLALGKSFDTGRFGRTWSPMVELLAVRELTAGAKVDLDVVPQFQVTLSKRKHIMANVGVRLPVNNTAGRSAQVVFYLIWDWFDGTMFEGW
ncbi:MAG TPA: c-type cytochrome [Terriglobales bacterium]|nr:c-type cytochrome [Terriglobales bacterium]